MIGDDQHELVLAADLESLRALGPWLEDLVATSSSWWSGVEPPASLGEMELAVHEIATNCVRHSTPGGDQLVLRASVDESVCTIHIIDRGPEISLEEVAEPDPDVPQVGGYGLMIVRQLTSRLDYRHVDGENTWHLEFSNPLVPESPTSREP